LQWTLFGEFPKGVLAAPNDKFMSPVGGESKAWFGQVDFVRDGRRLEIIRDQAEDRFSIKLDGKTFKDEEAEKKRDELLGLDMDTFVRAVLLQQSRIRGLLLDEPKERNKALDRLLGMETVEILLSLLKKKDFENAAEAWREKIQLIESHFESQQELLSEKLKETEDEARKAKFHNKYMSLSGLRLAYRELGTLLMQVAKKYNVQVEVLPEADSQATALKVSRAFGKTLQTIRVSSDMQRQLVPIEKQLTSMQLLQDTWAEVVQNRDELLAERDAAVREHGDLRAMEKNLDALARNLAIQQESLKEANQLRHLLVDARAYVTVHPVEKCPVCNQKLPTDRKLAVDLKRRIEGLTNRAVEQAEKRLASLNNEHELLTEAKTELEKTEVALKGFQKKLDDQRKKIMDVLGSSGLVEKKVDSELEKEIAKLNAAKDEIKRGVHAMEQDLEALIERERNIKDVLMPLISTRDDLARHERDWLTAKRTYAEHEKRATEMDDLATNIERIHKAILEAKNEIASEYLGKAENRAQELYTALVRHPFFDSLRVKTSPQAKKVDYSFEVSASGVSKSGREARLVLSDGQLTAAALALFYALAESSSHGLDLLYVDDPTQNLDHIRKEAMARVIAKLAKRKQIIVSTQDEDFVTLLDDAGYGSTAILHHFASWNRSPEVVSTPPSGKA
jgi:DNA repair exonuclease SbcCD ATPase subunit